MAEAMKLALADRDVYYADPLFVDVPTKELLSKEYADLRRPLIDLKKASQIRQPGDPRGMKPLLEAPPRETNGVGEDLDTTTCVVADKWGNIVAATPSGFNGVIAGKTGVQLGTRLVSLNTWKEPPQLHRTGKRPRITLTPGLVFKDGKPLLAIGVTGGDFAGSNGAAGDRNVIDLARRPRCVSSSPILHGISWFVQ